MKNYHVQGLLVEPMHSSSRDKHYDVERCAGCGSPDKLICLDGTEMLVCPSCINDFSELRHFNYGDIEIRSGIAYLTHTDVRSFTCEGCGNKVTGKGNRFCAGCAQWRMKESNRT